MMLSLSFLFGVLLCTQALAAPTPSDDNAKYYKDRPDDMCHVDIERHEKAFHHGSSDPFYVTADVYDTGNNKVAHFNLERCKPPQKHAAQECRFWDGLNDFMTLTPIWRKGAYQVPERDYVQVTIGNHTSFATDNAPGAIGEPAHCHQVTYSSTQWLTIFVWECNFKCCDIGERPQANESHPWVEVPKWEKEYADDSLVRDAWDPWPGSKA